MRIAATQQVPARPKKSGGFPYRASAALRPFWSIRRDGMIAAFLSCQITANQQR
jgi:hypothetical protein